MGVVCLRVHDLKGEVDFYFRRLGLRVSENPASTSVDLSTSSGVPLLRLVGDPLAEPPPRRSTGLYHLALRVPGRLELGRSLLTLLESGYPIEGAADHGVSEAIYLTDPEGNGIEIYRDRPREEWRRRDGKILMGTDPLDIDGILEDARSHVGEGGLAGGTRMGHVHLKVADIAAAEAFYCGLIGFDLVTRYGTSASFVSAGGYHHHLGFNTWAGEGVPPPPPGSQGLVYSTVVIPDASALAATRARLEAAAVPLEAREEGFLAEDPSRNGLLLRLDESLTRP